MTNKQERRRPPLLAIIPGCCGESGPDVLALTPGGSGDSGGERGEVGGGSRWGGFARSSWHTAGLAIQRNPSPLTL